MLYQYELPYSYITRITAQSDALYNAQRMNDEARRAAKRQRVAFARAQREKAQAKTGSLTWKKIAPGVFVSSRGGWKIIKHDDGAAGFELLRTINGKEETIDFFDTLGGCKKRVRSYRQ